MNPSDRMHALDAVRAFALLLGVALHATLPFLAAQPWLVREPPSDLLATVSFTIHMFRMPVFFLIAGFFGRMMLERRGTGGFIADRSKRILVPLILGLPIVMLIAALAYAAGALASSGTITPPPPPPGAANRSLVENINLIHLWFLYYLVMFYAAAVALWALPEGKLHRAIDAGVRFTTSGPLGPAILALPMAAYYYSQNAYGPGWHGFPAPFSVIPDIGALLCFGMFFAFGWLLHRQQHLLFALEKQWPLYCALAIAMWVVSHSTGELLAYMVGAWCWSFGLIGAAMRFLSGYSPVRRYLADASYWIYLMHIGALLFFQQMLHPLPWHWSVKYLLSIAGAMPILLLSYHYFVRFTFLGALLNGRRQPRSATLGTQGSPT